MNIDDAISLLKRGTVNLVTEEELRKKLSLGRPLRVKLGVDPTSPDLHLGHTVALNKLRAFQDLGHTAVLLIGDFTARVGDPSGRDETRPVLSLEKVQSNAETYTSQAFKVLDKSKTEIRFNSEWLAPFTGKILRDLPAGSPACSSFVRMAHENGDLPELLSALSCVTLSRLLERDDFKTRLREGTPITMLEMLYPIFQGYDSVALKADVELGGSDQIFNILMGRDMQKNYGQEPQVVLTVPLLVGTDGVKKMSKSYGNHIALLDQPGQMFGKVMSVSDELMWLYYELLTNEDLTDLKAGHPMEAKKNLARIIVSRFHGDENAEEARRAFESVFSKKELPEDMPVYTPLPGEKLSSAMVAAGLASGKNEARRLIAQNGVKLGGKKAVEDTALAIGEETVLQVGSRRFCKLLPPAKN